MGETLVPHRTLQGLRIKQQVAGDLALRLNGMLEGDASVSVYGVAPIHSAGYSDVAFWTQSVYSGDVRSCHAGVLLVPYDFEQEQGTWKTLIRVENPYASVLKLLEEDHEPLVHWPEAKIAWDAEIHPSAVVEGVVWPGARIGPHCVVPAGAEVGWDVELQANVTLYPGVHVGRGSVIQAGVVIGSRGYGFAWVGQERIAVPHYAGVEIGEKVEIGANSVIAAGFLEPTRIGDRTRLDSLVQVAHHCVIGADVYLASGVALAGGVVLEDRVEMGGGAKVDNRCVLGQGVRVAALSGVTRDIPADTTVAGFPAEPIQQWRQTQIKLRQLRNHHDIR